MEEAVGPLIDWGVASLSLAGQDQSGDASLVKSWGKKCLIAVIDGLGHGEQAAKAARITAETLLTFVPDSENLLTLVRRCHDAAMKTRGVVLGLALFDAADDSMTWLGVGNVEGLLLRADPGAKRAVESLLIRGGVVGYQLPPLRPVTLSVGRGDLLVFFTDGIRSGFERELDRGASPQQLADTIIAGFNRKTDDALVLVACYAGGAA